MSTRSAATAQETLPGGTAGVSGGPGVTIEKIRMVVRKLSVEGGACEQDARTPGALTTRSRTMTATSGDGSGSGDDPGDGTDGCKDELAYGPFYVELSGDALKGPVNWAFHAPVAAGTYHEVEIQVNTIPLGKAGGVPGLEAMANAHASILVDGVLDAGTPNEKPFTFSTPMAVEQEREGAISIGENDANVTLDFDPTGWFTAPGGGRLDPNDPTNQGQILANIRASLRLAKDDDGNGCDDERDPVCAAHP